MGCDIHIVMERREASSAEWVGLWASDDLPGGRPKIARRDYDFFSRLGVRNSGNGSVAIYPRNIPKDVSRLAWLKYMGAPTDHHSVSYATVEEFLKIYVEVNSDDGSFRNDLAAWDLLCLDSDFEGDHRLVFWFDN